MPALAPPIADTVAAQLAVIGQRIRAHRKTLRVSATTAAEASGLSRVTLHRIERGEPSVAMASYMSAVAALGLAFEIVTPHGPHTDESAAGETPALPFTIPLADYAQLKRLAWQHHGVTQVTPGEALGLYERNWRHVDHAAMDANERALIDALARRFSGGRLLV